MSAAVQALSNRLIRRPSETSVECGFSIDRTLHASQPPHTRVDYVRVGGRCSYASDLGMQHGDVMAVTADRNEHRPNDLLLVKWKGVYFIRRRSQIESQVTGYLRVLGSDSSERYVEHEILARVLFWTRIEDESFATELDKFF